MKRKELLVFFLLASLGCEHPLDPFHASNRIMVFESDRGGKFDIYLMLITGDNISNLTGDVNDFTDDRRPIFSPDGSKIVFESELDSQIYVMNIDGSNKVRLSQGHTPNFSPDGARIAFYQNGDVWLINTDGSNRRNVTNHPVNGLGGRPQFSPDGSKVTFITRNVNLEDHDICIINTNGSDRKLLARGSQPTFSPEGSKIVFRKYRSGNFEIYMVNLDGSNETNLTNHPANDLGAVFPPLRNPN